MHCIYFPLHCQHYLHSSAWHHATPFPNPIHLNAAAGDQVSSYEPCFIRNILNFSPPHFFLLTSWEVQGGKTLVCLQLLWEGSVFLLYNLHTYGILYMEMYENSSVGRDGLIFLSLNIIFNFTRPTLNLWINWKIIVSFWIQTYLFFYLYIMDSSCIFFF